MKVNVTYIPQFPSEVENKICENPEDFMYLEEGETAQIDEHHYVIKYNDELIVLDYEDCPYV